MSFKTAKAIMFLHRNMNIKYLKNKQIDRTKWDACVEKSTTPLVYGLSWYLDIVAENWDGLVEGDYEAVFPLIWRQKFMIKYIYNPDFVSRLALFSINDLSETEIQCFFKRIKKKFLFADFFIETIPKFRVPKGFNVSERTNYVLHLNKSYAELFSEFDKAHKKNINKSLSNSIELRLSDEINNVVLMKKEVWQRNGIVSSENKLFDILSECHIHNRSVVYSAYSDNMLCAAAYFKKIGKQFTLVSGSTELARKNGAMYLILDRFIQQNSNPEMVLDFAGSNIKSIADWNKGFGAEKQSYLHLKKTGIIPKIHEFIARCKGREF